MYSPSELDIPVDEWRPGQWELIQSNISALATENRPIRVLQAPPGTGKSVIALATARTVGRNCAILTDTKQLQDQYAQTFGSIIDLRGRNNFACLLTNGKETADEGICTVGEPCEYQFGTSDEDAPRCFYYERKWLARRAPEVVTSYSYYLRDSGRHRGALGGRGLLVLDECHGLEDHLRGWWSAEITARARRVLGVHSAEPSLGWLEGLRERAFEYLDAHASTRRSWAAEPYSARRDYRTVEILSEDLARVVPALEADPKAWVVEETIGGSVVYKPVLVGQVARDSIFRSANSYLLMSATINHTDLAELGLSDSDYSYTSVPSPFPVDLRPLLYWPAGKVHAGMGQGDLDGWVSRIDQILEAHPDEKGLIHTANYKLASILMERSRWRSRLISHTGLTRTDSLATFKENSTPLVMVSPSMTTGVDLPYDLCRFQIIGKIAWPYRGDPQVARRLSMPNGEQWYANRAAAALGQAYGRGVRASDDSAVTYIIDKTFDQLIGRWHNLLPRWVREALIRC